MRLRATRLTCIASAGVVQRNLPTLDLNFAVTKALDPRIAFTRASSATFVGSDGLIQTAASGVARFTHDPVTGESLGLLIEEARTNLVPGSQNFSNTYWPGSTSIRTNNDASAPNGTTTACLVAGSGALYGGLVRNYLNFPANATFSMSCFAKAGTYDYIGFRPTSSLTGGAGNLDYCYFNLTTGVATAITPTGGTVVSLSMQPFPNGWYRCVMVFTTSASQPGSGNLLDIALVTSTGSHAYSGTGNVLLWGAQVELGSIPTSYIPTVASTVTRAADIATLTGANFTSWFNASAGTIFTKSRGPAVAGGSQPNIVAFEDTPSTNFILTRVTGTGTVATLFVGVNSTVVAQVVSSSFPLRSTFNQASAYALNDFATTVNGGTVAIDTLGAVPVVTKAVLGSRANFYLNGTIARFTYYPTRLLNAELQALTAS